MGGKDGSPVAQGSHAESVVIREVNRAVEGLVMKLNIDRAVDLVVTAHNAAHHVPSFNKQTNKQTIVGNEFKRE